MSANTSYHMTPEQFRRYGRAMVDWIADYYERLESLPVLSQVEPGQLRAALPLEAPLQGETFDQILSDVETLILPGITHWQSPNFFAYFPANNSGPAILGEMLSAGLGIQGMLWATSPACTELETHVLDWLVDMLALPEHFKSTTKGGGVIQDSASGATLCAILAAREQATHSHSNEHGITTPLIAYASTQTHSSVEKALKIAGIGRKNLRLIEVDEAFAMQPDRLAAQIEQDLQAGLTPFFVCGTVGTTSSGAVDPLPELGQICRQHNLWLHVDAAMYGTAAICPELRAIHHGLEFASSYTFNPHKWMFTNFDCNCFFVANRSALINALTIMPEYLRNQATTSGQVFDYRDWQISLGRRFRALKLWFVIRHYGVEGLQFHIRQHLALAGQFAAWVDESPLFERLTPARLTTICFRANPPELEDKASLDRLNEALLNAVNATGHMYITHTRLNGGYTLRFVVGNTRTQERHVRQAWQLLQQELSRLLSGEGREEAVRSKE